MQRFNGFIILVQHSSNICQKIFHSPTRLGKNVVWRVPKSYEYFEWIYCKRTGNKNQVPVTWSTNVEETIYNNSWMIYCHQEQREWWAKAVLRYNPVCKVKFVPTCSHHFLKLFHIVERSRLTTRGFHSTNVCWMLKCMSNSFKRVFTNDGIIANLCKISQFNSQYLMWNHLEKKLRIWGVWWKDFTYIITEESIE